MKEPCSTEFISIHTIHEEIAKNVMSHHQLSGTPVNAYAPFCALTGKLQHRGIKSCIWIGESREGEKKMRNSRAEKG